MYRIMVVDDEAWVLKGIVGKINRYFAGRCQVEGARSGTDALTKLSGFSYDLLISDIRMPVMDGIQLIRKANELYPRMVFIIVSSYAEFSYAEQALNIGVSGYILKPIRDEDFVQTIEKALKKADQFAEIDELLVCHKNYSLEQGMNKLFHKTKPDTAEDAADFPAHLGDKGAFVLILLHIGGKSHDKPIPPDRGAVRSIAASLAEEIGLLLPDIFDNLLNEHQLFILLSGQAGDDFYPAADQYARAVWERLRHLDITVTLGMSAVQSTISRRLYRQAREGFEKHLLYGPGRIYRYTDPPAADTPDIPVAELALLKKSMERYDPDSVESLLKGILNPSRHSGVNQLKRVYGEIISCVLQARAIQTAPGSEAADLQMAADNMAELYESIEELAEFTLKTIHKLFASEENININNRVFQEKVLQYIRANYSGDLTVNSLAERFGVTPNYFSTVFVRSNGITFTQFLTRGCLKNK